MKVSDFGNDHDLHDGELGKVQPSVVTKIQTASHRIGRGILMMDPMEAGLGEKFCGVCILVFPDRLLGHCLHVHVLCYDVIFWHPGRLAGSGARLLFQELLQMTGTGVAKVSGFSGSLLAHKLRMQVKVFVQQRGMTHTFHS